MDIGSLHAIQHKVSDCENRLSRLYDAIENGIADGSDPTLIDSLASLKAERDQAKVAKDRAFAALMRENGAIGAVPFRLAYLRAVIDQVEVGDTGFSILGRGDVLEWLVTGNGATPAGVPSFICKWRAWQDWKYLMAASKLK